MIRNSKKPTLYSMLAVTLICILAIAAVFYTRPDTLTVYYHSAGLTEKPAVKKIDSEYIEVLELDLSDDNTLVLKVRGLKPCNSCDVVLGFDDDDYNYMFVFSVDERHAVVNRSDSNFANSHIVILITVVWAWLCTLIFAAAYFRQKKYSIYSYNTIIYFGFGLFFLMTALLLSFRFLPSVLDPSKLEMMSFYSTLGNSGYIYLLNSLPLMFIMSVCLFVSNIALWKREGRGFANTVAMILGFVLTGGIFFLSFLGSFAQGHIPTARLIQTAINSIGAVFLYLECMWIGAAHAGIVTARQKADTDRDYLIILGCGIRDDGTPTPLLKGRCDAAISFYNRQLEKTGKKAKFIASGGQGSDEIIPEAESMKNYLVSQGISENDIIMENRSTTTLENFKFSKKLIPESDAKIAFFTTKYHVFRSGIWARRAGFSRDLVQGEGSSTRWYFWPNAFVREFAGLMTNHKLKQILIIVFLVFIQAVMTMAFYLR